MYTCDSLGRHPQEAGTVLLDLPSCVFETQSLPVTWGLPVTLSWPVSLRAQPVSTCSLLGSQVHATVLSSYVGAGVTLKSPYLDEKVSLG